MNKFILNFFNSSYQFTLSNEIKVFIKKTNRKKSISVIIRNNEVFLNAPNFYSNSDIEEFLEKKAVWIKRKLDENKKIFQREELNFQNNEILFFFGSKIKLKVEKGFDNTVLLDNQFLIVQYKRKNTNIKLLIEEWYRTELNKFIKKRVDYWAEKMSVNYKYIFLKIYNKRLGSCSINGHINFNWKIVMLPYSIIDYIIIHELAHIIHFDHSKIFWLLVDKYNPSYKRNTRYRSVCIFTSYA